MYLGMVATDESSKFNSETAHINSVFRAVAVGSEICEFQLPQWYVECDLLPLLLL